MSTMLAFLFAFVTPFYLMSPAPPSVPDWTEHALIAHGMGGMEGDTTLTNSREAFVANYELGFRVFEADLRLSSDGRLVALHDWTAFLYGARGRGEPDPKDRKPIAWSTFKSLKVGKKYETLDIQDIVQLLERYPDAYIVTDTKDRSLDLVRKQFALIAEALSSSPLPGVGERIVPQIYNPEMYEELRTLYPFSSYIYTLYGSNVTEAEVIRFVKQTPKIQAVTMPTSRVNAAFVSKLSRLGVRTYTHTVNDPAEYDAYRKLGIDGVYTDFLIPEEAGGQ